MSLLITLSLVGAFCLGLLAGLAIGHRRWAPKWLDTPSGIDRRFRKLRF